MYFVHVYFDLGKLLKLQIRSMANPASIKKFISQIVLNKIKLDLTKELIKEKSKHL